MREAMVSSGAAAYALLENPVERNSRPSTARLRARFIEPSSNTRNKSQTIQSGIWLVQEFKASACQIAEAREPKPESRSPKSALQNAILTSSALTRTNHEIPLRRTSDGGDCRTQVRGARALQPARSHLGAGRRHCWTPARLHHGSSPGGRARKLPPQFDH